MDDSHTSDEHKLRENTCRRIVGAAEFLRLLMSRRHLERSYGQAASLCSLSDRQTGEEFVTDQAALLRHWRAGDVSPLH